MLRNFFIKLSTSNTARRFTTDFGPTRRVARRFVAGETLDDAVMVGKELNAKGIKTILNHVGEAVTTQAEAVEAAKEFHTLVWRIDAEGLDSSISIKPSHVGLGFGRDFCYENIADIVQVAQQYNISTEIDIEGSADVDNTLHIYHQLLDTFGGGIRQAIQTYLHRTPADLERIIQRGGSARLVKGAYNEPPEIALQDKQAINQATIEAINMFLAPNAQEKGAYLALGSHDPKLIDALLSKAKIQNISPDNFEIQMLLGVRRDEQERLANMGYQVRVYVPYGQAWYPYFMRRLAERPANVLFIARAMFGG